MKSSSRPWFGLFLVAALPALAWIGFQAGRHRLEVHPRVVARPSGDLAFSVSLTSLPPDTWCLEGGHVTWKPGLLWPQLIEAVDDSESCSD